MYKFQNIFGHIVQVPEYFWAYKIVIHPRWQGLTMEFTWKIIKSLKTPNMERIKK
jgi:hypothetical protein